MQQADGWQLGWDEPKRSSYKPERSAVIRGGLASGNAGRSGGPDRLERQDGAVDVDRSLSENLAALIHDARNMVSAIDLYCDLLEEPGILSAPFRHYAGELRLVGGASRRLLEKLAVVESAGPLFPSSGPRNSFPSIEPAPVPTGNISGLRDETQFQSAVDALATFHRASGTRLAIVRDVRPGRVEQAEQNGQAEQAAKRRPIAVPREIASVARELEANRNLLSALAGPAVTVGLSISGGDRPIPLSADDFIRILVNLTRNAADAMPAGGHLQIALAESPRTLSLSFTDSGTGISEADLETVFSSGFSTHFGSTSRTGSWTEASAQTGPLDWPNPHRGLGLSIVRSLVSAAGGSVRAANLGGKPAGSTEVHGAAITIEFPLAEASSAP